MSWEAEADRFCHQYLQLEPNPDFPQPALLRLAQVQDAIYERLFAEGAVRCPPPARHHLRILKELVSRIEGSIQDWDQHDVSENLMSSLANFLSAPLPSQFVSAQQKCYVTYHLSALSPAHPVSSSHHSEDEPCITLLENRSLIAASGTTGLRTWDAALHLGQYLCQNNTVVKGKRILELGTGTGYLSILCANHLGAEHVIASDGSEDVINNLPENFFLNNLQDSKSIVPMEVRWGHALLGTEEEKWNGGRPVDCVLGADITYDANVIPALIGTILDVFDLHPLADVIISVTQRNELTFQGFLGECQQNELLVETLHSEISPKEAQRGPFYSDQVPIQICKCRFGSLGWSVSEAT